MKLPLPRGRWALLLPAFVGAAWLAAFGDKTPSGADRRDLAATPSVARPASAAPVPRSVGRPAPAPAAVAIEAIVPRSELLREGASARVDLFSPVDWTPPAKPVSAPPPPPSAPAVAVVAEVPLTLPYRVIGKKLEGEQWEVFLERDGGSAIARNGTQLEGSYRVERIEPPAMLLTHVPSGRSLSVAIGEAR
ncbi:hypothetical protein HLB44_19310 [Aquincola sp. S2]|uniref:Uncharacterized protein n=1 Tax=Pseudaquabacterium terrae TaxID=2732868 RepID=A0ABX2EKM1_9BURK|nr:hypothetical protein [Aquabacterium terrae]NRF69148.1 hypothetical protein [Aquabacterium terrae]